MKWIIRFHPDFFKDLEKLSNKHVEIFNKKKEKIKDNPERQKHLSGGENCYRKALDDNYRVVYYIEDDIIWFLTVGPHKKSYSDYKKRLHSLREKYNI